MRRWTTAAAALSVWMGGAAVGAVAPDVADLLGSLQRSYEDAADLKARFVQTSRLVASGMSREMEGRVLFKKGGKMLWEYEGDDPQVIVSDGTTLWIHQVRDRTVLRQELAAIPPENRVALDLLTGFEKVRESFHVDRCGELCLEMRPLEPRPDLALVVVDLEPAAKGVRAVTTEDPLGNRTRVEFLDVEKNAGVEEAAFAFQVPEGVQVLEMGAAEGGRP